MKKVVLMGLVLFAAPALAKHGFGKHSFNKKRFKKIRAPMLFLAERCECKERPCQLPCVTESESTCAVTSVQGRLVGKPKREFLLQFYVNDSDRKPITDGEMFLGQKKVRTDCSGKTCFCAELPCVDIKKFISATATECCDGELGDTSEFSMNIEVKDCRL